MTIPEWQIVFVEPGRRDLVALYEPLLVEAVSDFVRRSRDPDMTRANLMTAIRQAPVNPDAALWLVTSPGRLLGFVLAILATALWPQLVVWIAALYLDPHGTPRTVAPALMNSVEDWGRNHGAARIVGLTRRAATRAFVRLGFRPVAAMYVRPLTGGQTWPAS